MRYFVGHYIRGVAGTWHHKLTADISERFGLWKIGEYIPPHITLNSPFEMDDIVPVKNMIVEYLQKHPLIGEFSITEYGRFDDKVVFAKPDLSDEAQEWLLGLQRELFSLLPPNTNPMWVPHATLMYKRVPPEQIEAVWKYIHTLPAPDFTQSLDNITLFRKEDGKWFHDTIFDGK